MNREQIIKTIGIGLMTLGLIILSISAVTSVVQYNAKKSAILEFKAQNAEVDNVDAGKEQEAYDGNTQEPSGAVGDFDSVRYLVKIPKIDSVEPVKEGTDRQALAASLGHETGTALPGEAGNCVIAGHRNYTFGKFFNRLNEVEVGDMIYIESPTETYSYRVSEIKVVEPTQVEILENTEKEQLTLYTCTPIYIATHRLVVIADRV
jgi:sortase A